MEWKLLVLDDGGDRIHLNLCTWLSSLLDFGKYLAYGPDFAEMGFLGEDMGGIIHG